MIRRSLVRRGMTLIELSIVVAILGVIFSGIFVIRESGRNTCMELHVKKFSLL